MKNFCIHRTCSQHLFVCPGLVQIIFSGLLNLLCNHIGYDSVSSSAQLNFFFFLNGTSMWRKRNPTVIVYAGNFKPFYAVTISGLVMCSCMSDAMNAVCCESWCKDVLCLLIQNSEQASASFRDEGVRLSLPVWTTRFVMLLICLVFQFIIHMCCVLFLFYVKC